MSAQPIGGLGFQPPMMKRRTQRRRSTLFAQLITTVALMMSIAVVATAVTMGIGRAASVEITKTEKQLPR
jgi:hypothetical protein